MSLCVYHRNRPVGRPYHSEPLSLFVYHRNRPIRCPYLRIHAPAWVVYTSGISYTTTGPPNCTIRQSAFPVPVGPAPWGIGSPMGGGRMAPRPLYATNPTPNSLGRGPDNCCSLEGWAGVGYPKRILYLHVYHHLEAISMLHTSLKICQPNGDFGHTCSRSLDSIF